MCRFRESCIGRNAGKCFLEKEKSGGEIKGAFATNDLSKISGPAARKVVKKLRPFMKGIEAGPITLLVSNALRKFPKKKKQLSLLALEGEEMQRDYSLPK